MPFGYEPEEERDPEPPDFVRMQQELADLDVGDQEGDGAPEPPGQPSPPPVPGLTPGTMAFTPTQPPPRDDTLQRLQGKAQDVSRRSNLGRVGDEIAAAFGGYKPDDSYWDNQEKQGKQPVADYLQQRGLERQGKLDAQNQDINLLRMKALLAKAQGKPTDTAKRQLEEMSAQNLRELIQAKYGDRLKALGLTPEALSKYTLVGAKGLLNNLEHAENQDQINDRAAKSFGQGEKRQAFREHKQEYLEGQNKVSGWEGDKPIQPTQAHAFGEQLKGQELVQQLATEVKDMVIKNHGVDLNPNSSFTTALRQRIAALYPAVTASGGYGSLTQGHQHLLQLAVGDDPGKFSEYLKNTVNPTRLPEIMDALIHESNLAVAASAHSLGMRRAGAPPHGSGGSGPASSPPASAPDTRPRRTDPATGETRVWDGAKWVKP